MAKEDIILGPGKLYYAATGEAIPDETSVAYGAAWGGNWSSLGDTLAPLRYNHGESRKNIKTQQTMGKVRQFRTEVMPTVRTVLAEHTGANLALVLNGTNTDTAAGASQKGYSEVVVGNDPVVNTYTFGFETLRVASAGSTQPVRYFFHIASIAPDGDSEFDSENESGIPIVIEVYEDTTQSAGEEFVKVQVVTAPATS